MKEIFRKESFPIAPGGNIYRWQNTDTIFEVPKNGKYIIEITASAKSAHQNNSSDDDDLRVIVDDYEFGREESHQDKVLWKKFGVAASWDGASLQGSSKTIYFFMQLSAGEHSIRFWADETPTLRSIRVLEIAETKNNAIEDVIFEFNEQAPGKKTDINGIPWKAFIFASGFNVVNLVDITASTQSGKQKGSTDGDNIKVYVNGQIINNPEAPTSDKYKNFFFSGDFSPDSKESLMIPGQELISSDEDVSVELWYDETPILHRIKIELEGNSAYVERGTYRRSVMDYKEALNLPVNLYDEWFTIRNLGISALNIAKQHARKHNFMIIDDMGALREIVDFNEPDALRHFTWSVFLTREINNEASKIITTNHEIFWMNVRNKQELSRAGIMDMWNNKIGRDFANQYPDKGYMELFEVAKANEELILRLEDVTPKHREEVKDIINQLKNEQK
ncbi:hypothetical protein KJ652_04605 [Patescibacteria group bacterium]|nr:hypothetical protein [Patescibacteria group bacterium]